MGLDEAALRRLSRPFANRIATAIAANAGARVGPNDASSVIRPEVTRHIWWINIFNPWLTASSIEFYQADTTDNDRTKITMVGVPARGNFTLGGRIKDPIWSLRPNTSLQGNMLRSAVGDAASPLEVSGAWYDEL